MVSRTEAQIFADSFNLLYFEVSAALDLNVGLVFDVAAGLVHEQVEEQDGTAPDEEKVLPSCDEGEEERLRLRKRV